MEKAVNREVNCIFRRRNGNRIKYGIELFPENYGIYFGHSVDSDSFRFPIKKRYTRPQNGHCKYVLFINWR